VEVEELEQILDENPCQIQLELASELGVTQQVIFYCLQRQWEKASDTVAG